MMKSFLNKLAVFLLIAIAILFSIVWFLNHKVQNELDAYHENTAVNTLFIGDSRIQMTINDTLLPNVINLSRELESFNYTYLKLHALLNATTSIKKVYLGMSYSTLSNFNDKFIDGNFSTELHGRYFFIQSPEEKMELFKENSGNIFSLSSCILTNGFKCVFKSNKHYRYLGNYQNDYQNTRIDDIGIRKQIKRLFFENDQLRNFCAKNIVYFDKIVTLCKAKNVELIVFNTPLHPHYKQQVPAEYKEKYAALIQQHHLKLLDYSALVTDDTLFASDGQHVNQEGSLKVTQYFNNDQAKNP